MASHMIDIPPMDDLVHRRFGVHGEPGSPVAPSSNRSALAVDLPGRSSGHMAVPFPASGRIASRLLLR